MTAATFQYLGETARLSDADDGLVLAVEVNGTRMSASAWALAKKVYAAGPNGILAGDASHTDRQMLESAGNAFRTDPTGSRLYLDEEPFASKSVVRVPQDTTNKHRGVGVPGTIATPLYR